MYAGQRLVAQDGYEVALFPMADMYLTQGEYGSISHDLAMDFQGWSNGQRVFHCPYYAPFSCSCVRAGGSGENYRIFTSDTPVHCADGGLRVMTFVVMHDNNPIANVGDHFTQGDLIGHSGTAGPGGSYVGDHMHLNVAWGGYAGWSPTTHGAPYYELRNSTHIYDGLFVNDTLLVVDGGYNWRTYSGPPTPPEPEPTKKKKKKFPWFIYTQRRLNNLT